MAKILLVLSSTRKKRALTSSLRVTEDAIQNGHLTANVLPVVNVVETPHAADHRPVSEHKAANLAVNPISPIEPVAADRCATSEPYPLPASPMPAAPTTVADTEVKDSETVFTFAERRYRVRGLAGNMSYDVLKVNLLASRGERLVLRAFLLKATLAKVPFRQYFARWDAISSRYIFGIAV